MDKKRISMREVSRLSGVSIATVSRVIHNNGRFSEETAKRVMSVMNELNYTPDALAQGMRKRSLAVVGMIVPDILDDRCGLMVRTAQERLFEHGYSTTVFNSNENGAQSQRFIDSLVSQHASGLIYVADSQNTDVNLYDMPVVFFERAPRFSTSSRYTMVMMNDYEASRKAVGELISGGAKKILILGDRLGISSYQNREKGAIAAIKESGNCRYTVLKLEPQRTKATIESLENLFCQECDFDAIFSVSIRMTIGALKVIHDSAALKEKVKILGIGEHRLHEYGLLDYFVVQEPLEEMAVAAADIMVDLIGGKEVEKEKIFNCQLLDF